MGTSGTASLIRIMRNNLLDELSKPYVVTARAKGMQPLKAVLKYPVRVAINPLISTVGYLLPALISGSVIVSVVLSLPTIGPVLLTAIQDEDIYLAGFLYGVVGHREVARYLLVPHYQDGATWAILAFVMAGCLAGYLWYNANPSKVLMGDAGSRPMGFLLGSLVLACGNPILIFVVAGVVLVNGATGILKVALLRFFKIWIFKEIRYPLHDHFRHNKGWSNTQVLVRFMLLQAVGTPLLLVVLLKIR